jgi:hypothetical protein
MKNTFLTRLCYLFDKKAFQRLIDDYAYECTYSNETSSLLKVANEKVKSLEDELYRLHNAVEDEKFKVWNAELKFKLFQKPEFAEAIKNKDFNKAYDMAKVYIDDEGFALYSEAKKYTNIDIYSYYYTEDNLGYFENANGFALLRYLEVAAFGEIEWEQLPNGYEKAINMSLNTEDTEFQRYRNEICAKVLEKKFGITLIEPTVAMAV